MSSLRTRIAAAALVLMALAGFASTFTAGRRKHGGGRDELYTARVIVKHAGQAHDPRRRTSTSKHATAAPTATTTGSGLAKRLSTAIHRSARAARQSSPQRRLTLRQARRTRARSRPTTRARPARRAADHSPITIGVAYQDPAAWSRFVAKQGAHTDPADLEGAARAIVDHVNAAGGIGGHPVELRAYKYDLFGSQPFDAVWAQACTYFSDGPKPVAVISAGQGNGHLDLAPCLDRAGIPSLIDTATGSPDALLGLSSGVYGAGSLSMSHFAGAYVDALQRAGFFAPGTRVGILRWSGEPYDSTDADLRAELARIGVQPVIDSSYTPGNSGSSSIQLAAQALQDARRFHKAKIDRVIPIDQTGGMIGLFGNVAELQGYRPLYALSSLSQPAWLRNQVPKRQLQGAVGMGWMPLSDVAADQDDTGSPARAECAAALAGVSLGDRSVWGQTAAYDICNGMQLLRRALAGGVTSPSALRAGVDGLGTSFDSPIALATRLDSSHHDGVSGYRDLRYDTSCSCTRYVGPVRAFP